VSEVPYVLLPYQQRWLADDAPVKVWEKSRRIGASWAQAAESALLAAADKGMDTWYLGYNHDMAQEFIRDAGDWARHYQLAAGEIQEVVLEDEDRDIRAFRISFASGWRVTALSSRPTNLRGKQGLVVIDEAAFHDDFPGLLKAALALLMWGGRVVVLSTHLGDDNPFNELIQDVRAGKKPYRLHRTTLDDALAEGLYRRICLVRGLKWSAEGETAWRDELVAFYGDGAEEELFCVPSGSGGSYFSRSLVESRMREGLPVLRLACKAGFAEQPEAMRQAETETWCREHLEPLLREIPGEVRTYYGMDFGRSGDLSVIVPLVEDQGLNRHAPFVVELRNVPFRQQEQILFHLVDRLPEFLGGAMDARGNGQYLAEVAMQRYGASRIEQVMLTAEWYRDNFPRLKAAFEDGEVSLPKDADLLADLRAVTVQKGIPRVPEQARTKGSDGGQRHGDAAIALALAWAASRSEVVPLDGWEFGGERASAGFQGFMG
jgi:phage FluMu gp28-like protein